LKFPNHIAAGEFFRFLLYKSSSEKYNVKESIWLTVPFKPVTDQ
jgi:hypothetical protein